MVAKVPNARNAASTTSCATNCADGVDAAPGEKRSVRDCNRQHHQRDDSHLDPWRHFSNGNMNPVTLVSTVVVKNSAVRASSSFPPNKPNTTTNPERIPIRLMSTCTRVNVSRDRPKVTCAPANNTFGLLS